MKNILKNIWYSYLMENPIETNDEKKKKLAQLTEMEDKLSAELSDSQKKELRNIEDYMNELESLSETDAFIKGVRFATRYLIETLCGD